ncbi:hypothetical protein C0991_001766 [Blastosporella zonata]|nr:hypothetical protein C0991_001766 [Blastosporella zonata]
MPTNLQGLNIVFPIHHDTDNNNLLAGQSYQPLSTELDLWTNLAFHDDAPLSAKIDGFYCGTGRAEEKKECTALTSYGSPSGETAIHDGRINAVSALQHVPPPFDLHSFLEGFGGSSFSVPHIQAPSFPSPLTQLSALHSASHPPLSPITASDTRAAKRARTRTRKKSISSADSLEEDREETPAPLRVSAAEEKRRSNTAASARFRLRKKEREAALEEKIKELESLVNELDKECEGLRRENGWLKGLVVGVTGVQVPAALRTGSKRRD